MANLNRVLLIGNLTRDPQIKYTPKGGKAGDSNDLPLTSPDAFREADKQ
jgi:single-strand DNA-binding protein